MNSLDNEILKNYTNLKNKIEKYNNLYYNEDNPIISDMEYDGLLRKLKEMEKEYPALLEIDDSPTEKIGGTASNKFSKVEHKVPMLSLSNTYNIAEIEDFDKRVKKIINFSEKIEYILYIAVCRIKICHIEIFYYFLRKIFLFIFTVQIFCQLFQFLYFIQYI